MDARLGCSFLFTVWLGTGSPAAAQYAQPTWADVVRESGSGKGELRLLRDTADAMAGVSPTFSHMLGVVKSAPHLIMFVRAAVIEGKLGQTQFHVVSNTTFGVMDINPYRKQPTWRIRAIAHELAHAVEIACFPSQRDTSGLRSILLKHAAHNRGRGGLPTETRFPAALEQIVVSEYQKPSRSVNELSRIAESHGLTDCGFDVPLRSNLR
jgi:hypothetical protein